MRYELGFYIVSAVNTSDLAVSVRTLATAGILLATRSEFLERLRTLSNYICIRELAALH
jgi:hypothetical protein